MASVYTWGVVFNNVPEHMARARQGVRVAMEDVAEELVEQLKAHGPHDSGELARSWNITDNGPIGLDQAIYQYRISSTAYQAKATSTGTGMFNTEGSTGPLKPSKAKAMTFYWKRIGKQTAWKGDLNSVRSMGEFYRWAIGSGMQPFFAWPKGQVPNAYVGMSIAETMNRWPDIEKMAYRKVGAL